MNNKLSRALFITSPIIILSLISMVFSLDKFINPSITEDGRNTPIVSEKPPQQITAPQVQISSRALYEEYISNQTEADIKYFDKLIIVQGVLNEICPVMSSPQWVTLETGEGNAFVRCQLSNDFTFLNSTSNLLGKTITIAGICKGLSGFYLIIDNIYTNDLPTHTDLG
ncbi:MULTISPECIES: OB-fold putative lipoprotein [Dehalococcoides]|uniref:OB-fold putative lipoprotein n=1 Tax=Dehalococcoides TaxID=61434 RepID=UPI0002B75D73|nr:MULTISPECIES: OB-fold putative lipoprotein [Dehalococcoides]AGG05743.1 OB-fold containing protein [Dehalococcoides mccartyi DCMB5]BEL00214.1 hypothetical protein DMOBY_00670 [Dehalococcoides mccartyi]